ncbi:MAG: hypothetical protein C7B46_18670 [Sulfobacillus benefaciens]|uniref:Integrase n=1 Tax=Sulfobacillus benefaciens TaxID=453960 RepID=A0A2T2X477_9FIRM|nr:MAG: hypothetical protein C7B46_18670 [Sulfobacillus benefaciens]
MLAEDLADFTAWLLRSEQLDEQSIRAYRRAVLGFAEWYAYEHGRPFATSDLDSKDLQRWRVDENPVGIRGRDKKRPAPATRNKAIAGIRVFSRWAHDTGRTPVDAARHLDFLVIQPQAPRSLSRNEEKELMRRLNQAVADAMQLKRISDEKLTQAIRNRAVIVLGLYAGLRVEETAHLVWGQLLLRRGVAEVQHVQGKFNQIRSVPLPNIARQHLLTWKERALAAGWVREDLPLFVSQKGHVLSVRSIQRLMAEWGSRLGWPTLTYHTLRHTYASRLVNDEKKPLPTVATLMGHLKKNGQPNIATTARYTIPSAEELQRAVDSLDYDDDHIDEPTIEE